MQATTRSPPKDDFTVFKDPTIALKMGRSINLQQPQSPTTQSPIAKRGRLNEFSKQSEPNGKENVSKFLI